MTQEGRSTYHNKQDGSTSIFADGWTHIKNAFSFTKDWVSERYVEVGQGLNGVQNNVRGWMADNGDNDWKRLAGAAGVQLLNVAKGAYGFTGLVAGWTNKGMETAAGLANEYAIQPVRERLGGSPAAPNPSEIALHDKAANAGPIAQADVSVIAPVTPSAQLQTERTR